MNDIIAQKLKTLPGTPGVYIMKDASDTVIYVGKAISLKNRVRSYFQSSRYHAPKIQALVPNIHDFEYILCESEMESLIMECNLIKRYQPRYNSMLKDDKHYPYVRIDAAKRFPRIEIVRAVKNDGAKYFGPYLSAINIRDVLEAVNSIFLLRTCAKDMDSAIRGKERPCINYQIGKCCAPCTGNVSDEEYAGKLGGVTSFLHGKYQDVINTLTRQMNEAAEKLEYETAARARDNIELVKNVIKSQRATAPALEDKDVIALALSDDLIIAQAIFIRRGKVVGSETYDMSPTTDPPEIIMDAFVTQFYQNAVYIPREILVSVMPENHVLIEQWLSDRRGGKTIVLCPQRGEKRKYVQLAESNAQEAFIKRGLRKQRDWALHEGACAELAKTLNVPSVRRIECYDISNIQGYDSVASMVVFIGGRAAKKEYRRFRIKTVEGADDFASMAEVLARRLTRYTNGDKSFAELPDLIVIDGGKGQLHSAGEVIDALGFSHVKRIGLAKREEEIFLPGDPSPILLPKNNHALHLLQRVRDEAHRFAITHHRTLRGKRGLLSELEEIQGVGPKRRKALFAHFQNVDEIKNASPEELSKVDGMTKSAAEAVYKHFNN